MKKLIGIYAILLPSFVLLGQSSDSKLKGFLTLTPGFLNNTHQGSFYLHGALEIQSPYKISFYGTFYSLMDEKQSNNLRFDYYHQLYFGGRLNWQKNRHNFSIGLLPGIGFLKYSSKNQNYVRPHTPLVDFNMNYHLSISDYFYLFSELHLIYGNTNGEKTNSLTEIRPSIGLGFQISNKRKNKA